MRKKLIINTLKNNKNYLIWLVGIIVWNYAFPQAAPLLDVLAAVALSILSFGLKKYLKF